MTNCCFYHCIMFIALFASDKTNGQATSSDSSVSFVNTITYFQNQIAEDAHLYTGKQYTAYEKGIKGHPFFLSAEMNVGTIFYDGTLYKNIPLLFDIVRQQIVINRYNQEERIQLLNEKLKYFTVAGHWFENVALLEGKDEDITTAIYDRIYNGKATVLVKRLKRIKNALKAEDPPEFVEEDAFFIRNGTSLYVVDNRSSLLDALKDNKELIKRYIQKNKFRLKKNVEKELVMTAAYYSTLND
jgi:hypothetical protein